MDPKRKSWLAPIVLGAFVMGGVLDGAAGAAFADGVEVTPGTCMQRVFIGQNGTVNSSNLLNCTAKDIKLSKAIESTISPTSCDPGAGPFTLHVDFEVDVTSNERYDAGFFFRVDGGASARGDGSTVTGTCKTFGLDRTDSPALNLDGDTCGDLNQSPAAGHHVIHFDIPNVACVPATGTSNVKLPYCTSWHSNARTSCNIANVFSFNPDTKSKCNCDDGFSVPVVVANPSGGLVKTAVTALVTYEITIQNTTAFSVNVTALDDDIYGDITTIQGEVTQTGCGLGTISPIAGNSSVTCQFKVLKNRDNVNNTLGTTTNTVTATVKRTDGQGDEVDLHGSTTTIIDLGTDHRPTP